MPPSRRCLVLAVSCLPACAISSAHEWLPDNKNASASTRTITGIESIRIGVGCTVGTSYPASVLGDSKELAPKFTYVVENPIAQYLSVHFAQLNLPENDFIIIRPTSPNTAEKNSFTYHSSSNGKKFFSDELFTDSITIELYAVSSWKQGPAATSKTCTGFAIDSYRFYTTPADPDSSAKEAVCGADDTNEAACYKLYPAAYNRSLAIARLLVRKAEGNFFCTGWLVGSQGHMLTNNHCIATQEQASNTQYEFGARSDSCDEKCNVPFGCRGSIRASNGQLVVASPDLDYALVKLDASLAQDYGFLQVRESGAVMDERIYLPQHPAGWGARIAMKAGTDWGKVEPMGSGGCLVNQVAYSLDTQGGSSGSPVIGWSDNAVVAIHHCGGCPNTAVNMKDIVADLRTKDVLPADAVL